jgi:excisionase family DNA binding protein
MLTDEEAAIVSAPAHGHEESLALYSEIRAANAKLARSGGKPERLPPNLHSFLLKVLGELKAGKPVTILENGASMTMTTAAAARTLSVSRQFLVQLLERGQIPFHKVGTHRRVYVTDLLAYKAKRDEERRKILDDLVRKEYDEGLYDLIPVNVLERD